MLMAVCNWEACSRVTKPEAEDLTLQACDNNGCERSVHRACLAVMLSAFGVDKSIDCVICGKRCYNAVVKANRLASIKLPTKKRIPWHNDGPDSSVSSLGVLIKWLADGNNYHRYRGGEGQSGETKKTLATEVVNCISESGATTARTQRDVMNKILGLESSFRVAADWLANTRQGVDSERDLRAAILQRCPRFYELQPIMEDSPRTHPLCSTPNLASPTATKGSESSSSEEDKATDVVVLNYGGGGNGERQRNSEQNNTDVNAATDATAPSSCSSATPPIQRGPRKRRGGGLVSIANSNTSSKNRRVLVTDHTALVALREKQLMQQNGIEQKKLDIQNEEINSELHEMVKKQRLGLQSQRQMPTNCERSCALAYATTGCFTS